MYVLYLEYFPPDYVALGWVCCSLMLSLGRIYFVSTSRRVISDPQRLIRIIELQIATHMARELAEYSSIISLGELIEARGEGASEETIHSLPHIDATEESDCTICLDKVSKGDKVTVLRCAHYFHAECVDKWLEMKAVCPLCKGSVESSI